MLALMETIVITIVRISQHNHPLLHVPKDSPPRKGLQKIPPPPTRSPLQRTKSAPLGRLLGLKRAVGWVGPVSGLGISPNQPGPFDLVLLVFGLR